MDPALKTVSFIPLDSGVVVPDAAAAAADADEEDIIGNTQSHV